MALLPSITFEIDLSLFKQEAFGPLTNESSPTVWHPDMFQSVPDLTRETRRLSLSTWHPGMLCGENRVLKHGDQFTIEGAKAIYIRNMYAVGYAPADRAYLKII